MRPPLLTIVAMLAVAGCSPATADKPLILKQTIALDGVSGRIDHMAADAEGNRLFVAALGNNTVEIIDLHAGKRAGTIQGLKEPQGVLFIPELNRIVVASGGDGTVRFFDGKSLQPVSSIDLGDDADNIRYDPAAKRIYVG